MADESQIDVSDIQPVETSDAPDTGVTQAAEPVTSSDEGKGIDKAIESAMEQAGFDDGVEMDASGRLRDRKTKKFVAKAGEATEEVSAAPTLENTAETVKAETATQQPIQAPSSMSEADKAAFAKLPADAQKWISTRHQQMEADYTRKTQEIAEVRKSIEPLAQRVQHWSPYLQKLGVAPDQAFEQMLSTEYALRVGTAEQKLAAFKYLADLYHVPVNGLATGATQQQVTNQYAQPGNEPAGDDEWVDPAVVELRNLVNQQSQQLQQMLRQQSEAERAKAEADFASIGATKDEHGNPKFPHFGEVGRDMIRIVAEGQADNWDDAYEMAVWARKDLRANLLQEHQAKLMQEEEARRQEAVKKARGAAPVRMSPGVGERQSAPKGLDAHIEAALGKIG